MKKSDLTTNPNSQLTQIHQLKQSSTHNRQRTFFLKAPLTDMSLQIAQQNIVYLWLDRRALSYSLRHLNDFFKRKISKIEVFDSAQEFNYRIETNNGNTIFRVILSITVPQKVFDWVQKNRYVDIVIIYGQCITKINTLKQKYSKIQSFGRNSGQIISKTQLKTQYKNTILVQDEDIIVKRYQIMFHSLLNHNDEKEAIQDFVSLAKKLYPHEEQEIQKFQQQYFASTARSDKQKMVKYYLFRCDFYWQIISTLPKITHDLRKVSYIRTIAKDVQQTIQNHYNRLSTEQRRELQHNIIYIVVELSQQQIYRLSRSQNKYITFTGFVKGFTDQNLANQYLRSNNCFTLSVNIPAKEKSYPGLDYGFIIDSDMTPEEILKNGGNVVFALKNFFKVIQVSMNNNFVKLSYSLSVQIHLDQPKRWNNQQYRQLLKENARKLFDKNMQIQQILKQVHNQGTAMSVSGWIKESDQYYEQFIQKIRNQGNSQIELDRVYLQKGDNLLEGREYAKAIQTFSDIKNSSIKVLSSVRMVRIHIERGEFDQAKNLMDSTETQIRKLEQPQQYVRLKSYRIKILIAKQDYLQAYELCRQLKEQIVQFDSNQISLELQKQIDGDQKRCGQQMQKLNQI